MTSQAKSSSDQFKFPIAGIGASAGGLEAFKGLLSHMPVDAGMALVLIQHLDPKHGSMSAEILARATKMPVGEAVDGVEVQPNHVYVIPPNCNLSIGRRILHVEPRIETRGQHMPFDYFLQSLAKDLGSQAIGVVLSGTASDGTEGLRAIKAEGGITLVQSPESAKYDGMPKSAIASGAVDLIRTPEGIAEELTRIAKRPYVAPGPEGTFGPLTIESTEKPPRSDESLNRIFASLRTGVGVDFSHYKHSTIQRRIARRMLLQKTDDRSAYAEYLERNPDEVKALFADILIHVTGFFRDPKAFEALKTRILPGYMKNRDRGLPFRVWVPGCSTGEEAYSIAMISMEFMDKYQTHSKVPTPFSIFATDISEQALVKARQAVYPESIAEEVSKERLRRFFERTEGGYRIAKWLRDTCLFSRHDLTRDPPFAKVDLISCRNLLIYFDVELQKRVVPLLHYALNPDGILMLGRSETIGGFSNIFELLDKVNKLYVKKNVAVPLKVQFPVGRYSVEGVGQGTQAGVSRVSRIDLKREYDRVALSEYVPPSVIINDGLDIVQSHGRLAPFLGLGPGQPSLNLLRMAHPQLIPDLKSSIQLVRKKNAPIVKEALTLTDEDRLRTLSIRVVPMPVPPDSGERYFSVFFEEDRGLARGGAKASKAPPARGRPGGRSREVTVEPGESELRKQLSVNQEYQQSLIEEYETSQEELISSNEELQSSNEELQSTNEELETAKEELQSANEELTTVNDEMQTRNTEMLQVTNDLTNLLASVDIPIVMVGPDGKIRRFTPKAGTALKLIPTDVGRPIGDIKPGIEVLDLDRLVVEAMETMRIRDLETRDQQGRWCNLQVRPYRTADNRIDGAVIALFDIDAVKRAAEEAIKNAETLKKANDDATTIIMAQPLPLLVVGSDRRVKLANERFYRKFQVSREETEGRVIQDLGNGQWDIPVLLEKLAETLDRGLEFETFEVVHEFPMIGPKTMLLSARRVHLPGSRMEAALLAIEDITERNKAEIDLRMAEEKYRGLLEAANDGIIIVDRDMKIEFANEQLKKMFGYRPGELKGKSLEILIPERYREQHEKEHTQYMKAPRARDMGSGLALYGRRKDGSEFPVEISLSPIKTPAGLYVTAIIRDITARKKVEQELAQVMAMEKEARAGAERANKVKDDFLATLSHELRTPLTAILSWTQMFRLGKLDAATTKRGIEILEQSAKAQGQLINDLLDVSRIQSGKLVLNVRRVDPSQSIRSALDSIRTHSEEKSIQIMTKVTPGAGKILADPDRLQQILWNLLTNAIKFTPENGKIEVSLDRVSGPSGERVRIRVSDTGKGISPGFLPHIFDRFSQADTSSTRLFGGLGLGLAIVRNLAEMQGGSVEATSPGEGKGATFAVSFPLKPENGTPASEEALGSEVEKESKPVKLDDLRILVVDDEANAREIFSVMLQAYGAKVKTARSAAEALSVLTQFKPDILLSDIAMPEEDGYSLIRKVRTLEPDRGGKTPAIAVTAYAGGEDTQRALDAGFCTHLAKPVDAVRLTRTISQLLEDKKRKK